MARYRKLATICAAIVLPFGLAACGGGGSDDAGTTTPPPPTGTVMLPDGHGLNPGTTTLAAGQVLTVGDTTISCPGASACMLTVSKDSVTGAYSATWTGGAVTVAVAEPPPPPPGPDPVKLAEARDGARDAWRAARAALAGIAGKQSANMAAYQLAMDAVDDAKDAYDAALAAETVAEAERQKENADAANERAMGQVAAVIASYEAPALEAAQMAAKSAADAAKKAYDDAKDALDAVEAFKDVDMDSYNEAKANVDAAKAAYDAAKAASDAAAGTSVLADAKAGQSTAQDQLANANTAKDDATEYAGMVQAAENKALSGAQSAAQTAYDAAKEAYDDAKKRVDDLTAKDVADYVRAMDALVPVKAALDAAESANDMAQAATTSADAKTHQATVEEQRDAAVTEKADVDMYAALVEAVQNDRADEEQREKDVASARSAAKASYEAAETDATNAEAQADAAEETAPGTDGAIAARKAATAARTAAIVAKAAHDAITDGMTKAEADAKAADAATQAGNANAGYMTAKAENQTIQTAAAIGKEQQRKQAIADARSFGGAAVANAKTAADDAQDAADAAKTASDNANAAYQQAMTARTDADEAKKQADAAAAAHTAAQAAADDAMTAYEAAKAAIDSVTDDSTRDEANTARMTAQTQAGMAATSKTTAMTQQTAAEGAETKAVAAAGSYTGDSLGLLAAANDADQTDAKKRAARIKAVAGRIAAATSSTPAQGNNDSRTGTSEASATVVWDENVKANPNTNTPAVTNYVKVTITGAGDTDIVSETQNVDANDDGDFDDSGDTKANAKTIAGLPGFTHGQDITFATGSGDSARNRHVIVFTNKVQDTAAVTAKGPVTSKKLNNQEVSSSAPGDNDGFIQVTVGDLGTASGNGYTGVTLYTGAVTINDDTDTRLALMGTLTCPSAATCDLETDSDGKVTKISGYKFSGSRSASPAVSVSDGVNNDYLVFGVWMDDATTPIIGAFANGAAAFNPGAHTSDTGDDGNWAALVGKATYKGAAAGLYTKGTSVDFFKGDATLKADFGKAPTTGTDNDTNLGSISGMIDNIMAGGTATGDVIYLDALDDDTGTDGVQSITDAGAFDGRARMGSATTNSVTGDSSYPYKGTWSGQFRGPNAKAKATGADTLPPDVVGTFGVTGTDKMGTPDDTKDDVTTSYVGAFGASQ